jgi:hypothetical protein
MNASNKGAKRLGLIADGGLVSDPFVVLVVIVLIVAADSGVGGIKVLAQQQHCLSQLVLRNSASENADRY